MEGKLCNRVAKIRKEHGYKRVEINLKQCSCCRYCCRTIAVAILEQRQRKFCAEYLQNYDLQFSNLSYSCPRLLFTLIFSYKRSTIIRNKEGRHPKRKTQRNKRKTRFKRGIKGYIRGKITEINWELNPSYFSLAFAFSIYSWGCVSWLKLCSLFFFYKPWTKFICSWVIKILMVYWLEICVAVCLR